MKAITEQRRKLFGGSTSRNVLAHLEESANRNPNSATAQYAFYQALMKANMPAIIIERYQSNQFATNNSCDSLYSKALASIGQSTKSQDRVLMVLQISNYKPSDKQSLLPLVEAMSPFPEVKMSAAAVAGQRMPLFTL
jgi:ATP-dependent metalloprotease